jgi:hypothetical protein
MPYRFNARSTTPGDYCFADGVLTDVLSAANVADGVDRGDGVDGTYSPGGTFAEGQADQYTTDQNEVTSKADHLDNTQTICGISGTLNMALWELVTTGDSRVAAQLQTDKDAVTAGKADILNTRTILTVTGTFDLTAYTLTVSIDYPDLASVLDTDTAGGSAGTYHEATTGEVADGVHFGPASAYVGTFVGTGGSGGALHLIRNTSTGDIYLLQDEA